MSKIGIETKDFLGQPLAVGDWIAAAVGSMWAMHMTVGIIDKFNFRQGDRKVTDARLADRYTIRLARFPPAGSYEAKTWDSVTCTRVEREEPVMATIVRVDRVFKVAIPTEIVAGGRDWVFNWVRDFRYSL